MNNILSTDIDAHHLIYPLDLFLLLLKVTAGVYQPFCLVSVRVLKQREEGKTCHLRNSICTWHAKKSDSTLNWSVAPTEHALVLAGKGFEMRMPRYLNSPPQTLVFSGSPCKEKFDSVFLFRIVFILIVVFDLSFPQEYRLHSLWNGDWKTAMVSEWLGLSLSVLFWHD